MALVEFVKALRHDDVRLRLVAWVEVDGVLHADAVGVDQASHQGFGKPIDNACVQGANGRHLPHFTVDEFEAGLVGEEALPAEFLELVHGDLAVKVVGCAFFHFRSSSAVVFGGGHLTRRRAGRLRRACQSSNAWFT